MVLNVVIYLLLLFLICGSVDVLFGVSSLICEYMCSLLCVLVMLRLCIVSWLIWLCGENVDVIFFIDSCFGWYVRFGDFVFRIE